MHVTPAQAIHSSMNAQEVFRRQKEALHEHQQKILAEQKEKEEQEAREANARLVAQEKALAQRREQERLDAPRRYAANLWGTNGAPVYYFDTDGCFQELGKERPRRHKPLMEPPRSKKRVRRVVDRWVYGPNDEYNLEAGECELVEKVVFVLVDDSGQGQT